MADQNIKNLEDLQDEYDFKVNTLKNRGEENIYKKSVEQRHYVVCEAKLWFKGYTHLFREWDKWHDTKGAGEREDDSWEDVLWTESQTTGEQTKWIQDLVNSPEKFGEI